MPYGSARKLTSPIVRELHWPPFKNASTTNFSLLHPCQFMEAPFSLFLTVFIYISPSRSLRSASRPLHGVLRPRDSKKIRYGQRTFNCKSPPPSPPNSLYRLNTTALHEAYLSKVRSSLHDVIIHANRLSLIAPWKLPGRQRTDRVVVHFQSCLVGM